MRSKYVRVWLLAATLLVVAALQGACSSGGADSGKFPIELTDSRVAAGEKIYARNCASCHGPVQGPVVLAAAPVHGDAGHTWHHPGRLLHQWVLDRPPHSHASIQGRPHRRRSARSARLHQKYMAARDTGAPGPGFTALRESGRRTGGRLTAKYRQMLERVEQHRLEWEGPRARPGSQPP